MIRIKIGEFSTRESLIDEFSKESSSAIKGASFFSGGFILKGERSGNRRRVRSNEVIEKANHAFVTALALS